MVSHFILLRVSFNEQRFLISKYWIHQYLSSRFALFVLCLGNSCLLLSYKNTLLNSFKIYNFAFFRWSLCSIWRSFIAADWLIISPFPHWLQRIYCFLHMCWSFFFLRVSFFFFFDVDHFQSLHWICSNTASALCFGFWFFAARHAGFHPPLHPMTRDQTWTPPSTLASEVPTTGKGVCQGCILSSCFF